MTQTLSAGSNRMRGKSWGVMAAVVGLAIVVGSFHGCAGQQNLAPDQVGDEPPIRVRNGSIELRLLTTIYDWGEDPPNDKKNWTPRSGPKGKNEYELFIRVSDLNRCPGGTYKEDAKTIELVYGTAAADVQTISIKSTGNHTRVKSSEILTLKGKLLEYSIAGGFIKRITVDGNTFCTFDEKHDKLRLVLVEP